MNELNNFFEFLLQSSVSMDVPMDSFTDDSAVPTPCGSSGVAVRKRKSNVDKSAAEANASTKSKEREIAMAEIACAMEQLKKCQQPSTLNDDFHVFGMFVASELRTPKHRNDN